MTTTTPVAPTKPRRKQSAGSCRTKCSGGYACVCTAKYRHAIHCCKNVECICRLDLRESSTGVRG